MLKRQPLGWTLMTRFGGDSHRGRGLLILGGVWVFIGVAVVVRPGNVSFPMDLLPTPLRSALWIVTGLAAIFGALRGAANESTKYAFAGLVIPATMRAGSFAYAFILWILSDVTDSNHFAADGTAWLGACSWALIALFVIHEASTPVLPKSFMSRHNE